jgi:uncharacterized Zn finger protein
MEVKCSECSEVLPIKVLKSHAGFYVGYFCPNCGPYDRQSDYYKTREDAEAVLLMMMRA